MNDSGAVYLLECLKSFKGIKSNAEKAMIQLTDHQLRWSPEDESNSVAVIVRHLCGNLRSRFTDFLTTDGEKPGRHRDSEFIVPDESRDVLMQRWEESWAVLFRTLEALHPDDLLRTVYIRREPHSVIRALQRQLVHHAYHGGQIVYLCKQIRSGKFSSLSIPKGESGNYLTSPPTTNS